MSLPLITIPWSRLQVFGVLMQASAPWIAEYQLPALGLSPILKSRSKVALMSFGVRVWPFENLIPVRSVNL